MHMPAVFAALHRLAALFKGAVAQGKGGVQAELAGDHRVVLALGPVHKGDVLLDPLVGDLLTVAVGDFVTGGGADTGLARRPCHLAEASAHRVRARVVVDDGGAAALYCLNERSEGAVITVAQRKRLVEPPPELFQHAGEVLRRFAGDVHPAGEGAVKVHMAVDESGHNEAALGVNELCRRIFCAHIQRGAD